MNLLAWGCIILFSIWLYKKQTEKPKVWKVGVAVLAGIFSFSINFNTFETLIRLPILPLGVWILYYLLDRRERWQTYRPFAWLGFSANFIFLAFTLLAIPISSLFYPEYKITTYVSNIEHASVANIHPSAKNSSLDKESLEKQINSMKHEIIDSQNWYREVSSEDFKIINEKFPYQLVGYLPKWGSDIKSAIYVEDDGKGILLTTSKRQFYYRTKESVLKGVK
ncbi:MAG: hypothetical protein K0S34_1334 [Bacillales bacterium]|jgi:hypothetical protein|nr:hypothetical protein [Bacillales bacterium]